MANTTITTIEYDDNLTISAGDDLVITATGALLYSSVTMNGVNQNIDIASQGQILSNKNAAVTFNGAMTDVLTNYGSIVGGEGTQGVFVDDSVGTTIVNGGTIDDSIDYYEGVAGNYDDMIQNTGMISGEDNAIIRTSQVNPLIVENSGNIVTTSLYFFGYISAIYLDDAEGVVDIIDNAGTISSSDDAIMSLDDSLRIKNTGTIEGGLLLSNGASADVDNSGDWQADNERVSGLNFNGASRDSLTNSGTIDAAVSMTAGDDTISNSGTLDGAVTFVGSGQNDQLTNAGKIQGAIGIGYAATITNALNGVITGAVSFGGDGTLDNDGAIDGNVTLNTGGGQLDNTGDIAGAVALNNGQTKFDNTGDVSGGLTVGSNGLGGDTITNAGTLDGGVVIDDSSPSYSAEAIVNQAIGSIGGGVSVSGLGATDTFENLGEISGAVSLATGPFTNDGKIDGPVSLKSGGDEIDNSGAIYSDAAAATTLYVSSGGGHDTIVNFGAVTGEIAIAANADALYNWSSGTIASNGSTFAVFDTGNALTMKNAGEIDGGVYVSGGSSSIWNWGAVNGDFNIGAYKDAFVNNGKVAGAVVVRNAQSVADKLHNRGEIEGGVSLSASVGEILVNALSGAVVGGVAFAGTQATLHNRGSVDGDAANGTLGVSMASGDDVLINRGSIDDAVAFLGANPLGHDFLLNGPTGDLNGGAWFAGADDTLVNRGVLDAQYSVSGPGSRMASGHDVVFNRGSIDGGLSFNGASATGHDVLYNNIGGYIDDGLSFAGDDDVLVNKGTLDNDGAPSESGVLMLSGHDYVVNDGAISGGVSFAGASPAGHDSLSNTAAATISGGVSFGGAYDTLVNEGTIDGGLTLQSGEDRVTNIGQIFGDVDFNGGLFSPSTQEYFNNSGMVQGNVNLAGLSIQFTNTGKISGNVYIDDSVQLYDTGTISGSLRLDGQLNSQDNTLDITGAINGGIYLSFHPNDIDSLVFDNLFGEQTIYNFIAAGNFDTITFTSNDFANYAAVQAAMTQTAPTSGGDDTIIRLDAADSITLFGVKESTLTSGNFKFV